MQAVWIVKIKVFWDVTQHLLMGNMLTVWGLEESAAFSFGVESVISCSFMCLASTGVGRGVALSVLDPGARRDVV